jgi:D-glycero-alpha-D-manno-heptose-7-phosphate kinase
MIITRTPLRISFLGGNTDFPAYYKKYGGMVLTTTIDKYIYCIVKERFDDLIYINYMKKEIVKDINDIEHDLVRESLRYLGIKKGIEITFLSDVPESGSGLGSSSTVLVGLLNALHCYKGKTVKPRQLAEEACKIELDILKKPIGVQDQYIAAFGGMNLIRFGKKITVEPVRYSSDFEKWLALYYTGKTRKSSEILRGVKFDKKILDENKRLVKNGLDFLSLAWMHCFGLTLDKYWKLKIRLNNRVTNKEIDFIYNEALYQGAVGGKICGAGGGGFLLLMVPPTRRKNIQLGLRELSFKLEPDGSKIIYNK